MNNNDEFMKRIPSEPGASPRIMVLEEVLGEDFYNKSSEITAEDIERIRQDWLITAPPMFQNLLDAEVE
jgi:hypothetical protein